MRLSCFEDWGRARGIKRKQRADCMRVRKCSDMMVNGQRTLQSCIFADEASNDVDVDDDTKRSDRRGAWRLSKYLVHQK